MTAVQILLLKTDQWYTLTMNGESLGEWQYVDDQHNGLCFLKPMLNTEGEYVNGVTWTDMPGLEASEQKDG